MTDKQPLIMCLGPWLMVGQRVHLQRRMPKSSLNCETPYHGRRPGQRGAVREQHHLGSRQPSCPYKTMYKLQHSPGADAGPGKGS